jgi:hypothetical protein
MVHSLTSFCAILALTGALASAQANRDAAVQRRLRSHPFQPQNSADFSPDPAPVGTQPAAQAVAPQAVQPGAQAVPIPAVQPPATESLPPPTSAQVTYRNNLLTVQATNSTLAGLLIAIRNKTGIQFEGLENGATERVAISMGPAAEGEVLAAILGGSKFDYVVVERPDSPGTVQRVLLSPRAGGSTAAAAAPAPIATNADGDEEDSTEEAENPQDTPVRPPMTQVQLQPQQQQPPQPKTPEQLLEELKRMQQQQQPQQGQMPQQNAPVKAPPIPQ